MAARELAGEVGVFETEDNRDDVPSIGVGQGLGYAFFKKMDEASGKVEVFCRRGVSGGTGTVSNNLSATGKAIGCGFDMPDDVGGDGRSIGCGVGRVGEISISDASDSFEKVEIVSDFLNNKLLDCCFDLGPYPRGNYSHGLLAEHQEIFDMVLLILTVPMMSPELVTGFLIHDR